MQSNQVNLNLLLRRNWQRIEALQINLRHLNSVRFHMKESFGHRMAKCMFCHLLWQKGHFFVTEHPINGSVCDVLDLNTFIVYEVEAEATPSRIKRKLDDYRHPLIEDLIIIDLRKMGLSWEPLLDVRDAIDKASGLRFTEKEN